MSRAIFTETSVRIPTPEQLYLEYPLAGLGRRALAALIDLLILGAGGFVLLVASSIFLVALGAAVSGSPSAEGWFLALLLAYIFLLVVAPLLYFGLFEYYWSGQTPGKKAANIRIMRMNGLAVDRTSIVLRNLIRLVDFLPSWYLIGIWAVLLTRHQQRLGDLAAGTIVVAVPPAASREAVDLGTAGLSAVSSAGARFFGKREEEQRRLVEGFLVRRDQLEPPHRELLARDLLAELGLPAEGAAPAWEQALSRWLTGR